MSVSGYLRCLEPDPSKILQAGGPLDQKGWKISKLWLPWQPWPWQQKNLPRAHKTRKRLWRRLIGWEGNCCHDFMLPWQPLCFHGNKKCTIGQSGRKKVCCEDVTMPSSITWVTFGGTVTSRWLSLTSWYRKLTSENQETSPRSPMAP